MRACIETTIRRTNARRRYVIPALWIVCCGGQDAQAAEFGNITMHSWIGRQLKASVLLVGDDARENEARCFKASVAGLNSEAAIPLKVTLQHSSRSSILLLTGGSAVEEPAATVMVENVCGTGAKREYSVLLDLVPEVAPVPVVAAPDMAKLDAPALPEQASSGNVSATSPALPAKRRAETGEVKPAAPRPVDIPSNAPFLSRVGGLLSLKMASMLANPEGSRIVRAPYDFTGRAAPGESAQAMGPSDPLLKLDRSLSGKAMGSSDGGKFSMNGAIAGALAILSLLGAVVWIAARVRAMRAASKPWAPIDAMLDADGGKRPGH